MAVFTARNVPDDLYDVFKETILGRNEKMGKHQDNMATFAIIHFLKNSGVELKKDYIDFYDSYLK